MTCGNGGSAADAQHIAAEFLVRLRSSFNRRALAAISLATDTSTMTACGNDYSFEDIFVRPLTALGNGGDVLLGISTSGNSSNVIKALKVARERHIITLGFLGNNGGSALPLCDYAFVVPSEATGRIQEAHIMAVHIVIETVENILLSQGLIHRDELLC